MLTDTARTTNEHMVSKYTETAYAFLPVPELRDKHTNTHTHAGRQAIFLRPSSRKAINAVHCNIWSAACSPKRLQADGPAPRTGLTTALALSSAHCRHCCKKQHREQPLMVETPQKPTDTALQPAPTSPGSQGREGDPKINSKTFPGAAARGKHNLHKGRH